MSDDVAGRFRALDRVGRQGLLKKILATSIPVGTGEAPDGRLETLSEMARQESDPLVLQHFMPVFAKLGGQSAVAALAPYLEHADGHVVSYALAALATTQDPALERLTRPLCERPEPRVRATAFAILRRLEGSPDLALSGVRRLPGGQRLSRAVNEHVSGVFRATRQVPALSRRRAGGRALAAGALLCAVAFGMRGRAAPVEAPAAPPRALQPADAARLPVEQTLGARVVWRGRVREARARDYVLVGGTGAFVIRREAGVPVLATGQEAEVTGTIEGRSALGHVYVSATSVTRRESK